MLIGVVIILNTMIQKTRSQKIKDNTLLIDIVEQDSKIVKKVLVI